MIFTKICMPSWRCLPSLGPNVVGGVGKPGAQRWLTPLAWASRPGKGLVGAAEAAPGKVLAGGTCLAPLLPCVLGLGVALAVLVLWFYLGSLPLFCVVWPWARLQLSMHR